MRRGIKFMFATLTLGAAVVIATSVSLAGSGPSARTAYNSNTPVLITAIAGGGKGAAIGLIQVHGRGDTTRTKAYVSLHELGHWPVRIVASENKCSANSRGATIVSYSFGATQSGSFFRTKKATRHGKLESIRSLRVFSVVDGKATQKGCGKALPWVMVEYFGY